MRRWQERRARSSLEDDRVVLSAKRRKAAPSSPWTLADKSRPVSVRRRKTAGALVSRPFFTCVPRLAFISALRMYWQPLPTSLGRVHNASLWTWDNSPEAGGVTEDERRNNSMVNNETGKTVEWNDSFAWRLSWETQSAYGWLPIGEIKSKKQSSDTGLWICLASSEINRVILNGKSQRLVKHSARTLRFKIQRGTENSKAKWRVQPC